MKSNRKWEEKNGNWKGEQERRIGKRKRKMKGEKRNTVYVVNGILEVEEEKPMSSSLPPPPPPSTRINRLYQLHREKNY